MSDLATVASAARRRAHHPPRPSPVSRRARVGQARRRSLACRAVALVGLTVLSGCFEAWAPSGSFGCSRDGTCPRGLECDRPFGAPAVCCDRGRGQCPTLPAPDGTCANGSPGALFFVDRDGDGFASVNEPLRRCARPVGAVLADAGPDCDDSRAEVNADTPEACNGRDDNCNGAIDEGLTPRQFFGLDEDGDGYPLHDAGIEACMAPAGTVPLTAPHDCQPLDPSKHPGAGELCNDFDDDCDGSKLAASYLDTQLASEPVRLPCVAPRSGVCAAGVLTCDQGRRAVCTSIVAPSWERCDGVDTDCDGSADDAPGCGGPPRLTDQPDFSYGGGLFAANATLTTACQKGRVTTPGIVQGARLSGSRSPMGDTFLLWWVEAPPGKAWDLSKRDARLRLKWTATG
ncbi:MAG: putative metal-binding motif-containing protein, partial [Myxococcaceae bacterium]|nr:putative metal-binding motif-containing protein [Myxococcaceae bacterium]